MIVNPKNKLLNLVPKRAGVVSPAHNQKWKTQ